MTRQHLWTRSHPAATTDRLPTITSGALPGPRAASQPGHPRASRTLRIPRVRAVILRDPVDQAAADVLDVYLACAAAGPRAALRLVNRLTASRRLSQASLARVDVAVQTAIADQLRRLRPAAARADSLLAAYSARCATCTAVELCTDHQHVLFRWWDLRDHAAVHIVNAAVAALAVPAAPTSVPAKRRTARTPGKRL